MGEKKKFERKNSPGQQLIMAAKVLKTNVLVIKYTGLLRQFGEAYCNVDAFYPNANSDKVFIIQHKHPTSVKSKQNTSLFQTLKYNTLQIKVSKRLQSFFYESFFKFSRNKQIIQEIMKHLPHIQDLRPEIVNADLQILKFIPAGNIGSPH